MAQTLLAPWYRLYREISEMFRKDPDVSVLFDLENMQIRLYVSNSDKAEALAQVLVTQHVFGDVTVDVSVIPSNGESNSEMKNVIGKNLYFWALKDNPALSYVRDVKSPLGDFTYVVFKAEVVQFFNDDLGDVNGNCSTLYQEIAKEIFWGNGVYFCTDAVDYFTSKPNGEWPN